MPTRSGKTLKVEEPNPAQEEASPATAPSKPNGLSEYELKRLANMAANEAALAALKIPSFSVKKEASSSSRPSQRGVGNTKRSASPALPTRTSSRTKNIEPVYTGIINEHSDGRIELASGDVVMPGSGKVVKAEDRRANLDPRIPIPFHRVNDEDADEDELPEVEADDDDDDDEDSPLVKRLHGASELPKPDARDLALLGLVTDGWATSKTSEAGRAKGKQAVSLASDLSTCTLDESNVVKATRSAVVHMTFQPRDDGELVLAAGDKDGHVSIWHASRGEDDVSDGVHLHKAHTQYVSGLVWSPHAAQALYSASYDGSIKCLDCARQVFYTLYYAKDDEISAFTIAAAAPSVLWHGSNRGEIGAADARTGKVSHALQARHARKVNTLSLDACGREWLLASSSTDGVIKVWDVRGSLNKPLVTAALPKASQAAEWAPDGSSRLAVTCFDDKLRVYSLAALIDAATKSTAKAGVTKEAEPIHTIKHCTQTGRWVVPFRATWTAGGDAIVCGGMKRTCEIFDASSGARVASLSDDAMTAIPSRNATHRSGSAIACATNSGRIHLFKK